MDNTNTEMKQGNPIAAGIKLFLADSGMSTAVGFIIGMLLGAAKLAGQEMIMYVGIFVGLPISFYSSFLLYRRYSREPVAFIALILASLTALVIAFPSSLHIPGWSTVQILLLDAATIILYGIGWYLAKETKVRIFLIGRRWIVGFAVVGVISVFIELLGFISSLTK